MYLNDFSLPYHCLSHHIYLYPQNNPYLAQFSLFFKRPPRSLLCPTPAVPLLLPRLMGLPLSHQVSNDSKLPKSLCSYPSHSSHQFDTLCPAPPDTPLLLVYKLPTSHFAYCLPLPTLLQEEDGGQIQKDCSLANL